MTHEDRLLSDLSSALQALVGERLSSVAFVQDYWQLDFDGNGFTIFSSITVTGDGWQARDGDDDFRNRLCGQITCMVTEATAHRLAVSVIFEDGSRIDISLRDEDYRGPEALTFQAFGLNMLYVV